MRAVHTDVVLVAYIDEIGDTGAFISPHHPKFNTCPVFGYAGFVIPDGKVREFGRIFTNVKRELFAKEIDRAEHPGRWERKGAELFRPDSLERYPHQLRAFNGLIWRLREAGGRLFYYAAEKPLGTQKQTGIDKDDRERAAMREALNRVARHAHKGNDNVMVLVDQINEKECVARLPLMYGHIIGRAAEFPEMYRTIEPPMHVQSELSPNIQFADWVAACVNRAIDYQLIRESRYSWITNCRQLNHVWGAFTAESKVRLWQRIVGDLHCDDIYRRERTVHPRARGHLIGDRNAEQFRRIKAAAERAGTREAGPQTAQDERT